ncbi:MAG: hypothetical protein ACRDJC_25020, partial [Thermomicrobiales bacterium]
LAAAGVGLGVARLPDDAGAKTRRKRKKPKQPRPNAFGCLDVGDSCTRASQCCSGICEGKKGKRRCRAHDTGGCSAGLTPAAGCGGTADIACTTSRGQPGRCATTTGNAGYCVAEFHSYSDFSCKTDVDCLVVSDGFLGPDAACVLCADGDGGTLCATPHVA